MKGDRGLQEIFKYTLDNGLSIGATKDHKFMNVDGQILPIDEIFERGLELKQVNVLDDYSNNRKNLLAKF